MNRKQLTKIIRWLDEATELLVDVDNTQSYVGIPERVYNNLSASVALLENESAFQDEHDYDAQEEYQSH